MPSPLRLLALAPARLDDFATALAEERLPTDDLREGGRLFFEVQDDSGRTVGWGGIEPYSDVGLLRSVVVVGERRRGVGRAIVALLEAEAKRLQLRRLYLLTTGAAPVFRALGYVPANRTLAPESITRTRQFAVLCPASAVLLCKSLAP